MPLKETAVTVVNNSGRDVPINERTARKYISEVARQEACSFSMIELVYVDEEQIQEINVEHLNHDYVTDIITFRYDEDTTDNNIEGTLFCCAQRIAEQAIEYEQAEEIEFRRVFVHGLLHLAGYNDQSDADQQAMRKREDFYLNIL